MDNITTTFKNNDCIIALQELIDDGVQVDSVVTDPPYELGFMGKSWDSTGIAFQKDVWELVFKVLKPGGHLLSFGGSRTYHRMAVAIEDAGFEIRDQIMWLYGSGFPKSLNIGKAIDKKAGVKFKSKPASGVGFMNPEGRGESTDEAKQWEGWGTALKPAHEPIVMARKPLSEKTVAENVLKHGTGGINIDGCRVEGDRDAKSRVRKAGSEFGQNSSWNAHKNVDTVFDPSKGRFPANIIHDGSEEVISGFPDKGSAARFFYCAKASKKERNVGLDNFKIKKIKGGGGTSNNTWYEDDVNAASGKFGSEKAPSKNIHPTVKPIALMKYLCRLVTPKNGTVLDPFMGSGSTGIAAKEENYNFIGIELNKEYYDIAIARININPEENKPIDKHEQPTQQQLPLQELLIQHPELNDFFGSC